VLEPASSICNLSSLETLDIKGTYVTKLPGCLIKLKKLKYIHAGRVASNDGPSTMKITDIPSELVKYFSQAYEIGSKGKTGTSEVGVVEEDTEEVDKVEDYPSFNFRLGVLLKRQNVHGVQVPEGIKKLQDLHTLGVVNVYVRNGKKILKELKKLTQLRKLGVIGIGKETSKEVCSAVSHLTHLESLSLRSEGKPGLKGCLDAISSQPPRYLQSLKLYGFLAELPKWISKLSYLVKLNLQSTRLNFHAIEILGELPNLTLLRLWTMEKVNQGRSPSFSRQFSKPCGSGAC